ncbi:hypothetical protein [Tumebacillus permanentifrigoris]|uniref:Uncharacterized protein n=1 Tax=Tumebacillus permanentifrigoris TaxID=378543 RepID=A0A316D6J9_9BACL|nr:hypothetical protein [Tumebacillus permanentifrigoris]PWK03957.1 hypothetical protein C7459_13813 [Tumebacillus permanentifrigoris]
MAMTATTTEQIAFEGLEVKLSYKQVELKVLDRLEKYNQNKGRIKVLEKQSIGHGIEIDVHPSSFRDGKDLLSLVHDKLKRMKESNYLSKHEQELAAIWREYMKDYNPAALSSKLAALRKVAAELREKGGTEKDLELINELIGKIVVAVESRTNGWGREKGYSTNRMDAIVVKRVEDQKRAKVELIDLVHEQEIVETALEQLGYYDHECEQLMRVRYIKRKSVIESCEELSISEKTHDRRKKKAVGLLAHLLGITNAN